MQLIPLEGNRQKLDGGAMFGHAPKALWSRWVKVDELNRIEMACRCLLIKTDDGRHILLETGIGSFFAPEMKSRYGVEGNSHQLLEQLALMGLSHSDIDYVVLSHLHFDHAGGLLTAWQQDKPLALLFDRAQYLVSKTHWAHALAPHIRDAASFVPELQQLLKASGRLVLVEKGRSHPLEDIITFHVSDGHTPGLLLAEIDTAEGPLVFASDLIPGSYWMHLPIYMGYDRFAEQLIDEKKALLESLLQRNGRVFFTHDDKMACGLVKQDERQRFYAQAYNL